VLEILERAEGKSRPVTEAQQTLQRQSASLRSQLSHLSGRALDPGIYKLGAALILAVVAAAVVDVSRLGGVMLAIASAIAFFSLWLPSRVASFDERPRWRGQDLGGPGRFPGTRFDPRRPRSPRRPRR
jgi:hypothetical protein